MCDYSLMALPNRLAVCGDELVVHRFELGTLGLAPSSEVARQAKEAEIPSGLAFLQRVKKWLYPPLPAECTAVCVPPGARLLVRDIPKKMQQIFCLQGPVQEVTFTQIGTVGFRDAICFHNGTKVLLQRLDVGQRVKVLALSAEDASSPEPPATKSFVFSRIGV